MGLSPLSADASLSSPPKEIMPPLPPPESPAAVSLPSVATLSHWWHAEYSEPYTEVAGKIGMRVTSKLTGIGRCERAWSTKEMTGDIEGEIISFYLCHLSCLFFYSLPQILYLPLQKQKQINH